MTICWWAPAALPSCLGKRCLLGCRKTSWEIRGSKSTMWNHTSACCRYLFHLMVQTSPHINCGYVDMCFSAVNKGLLLLQWKSTLDLCMPRVETSQWPLGARMAFWKCKGSLIFKKICVSTAGEHVILYSGVILRFKDSDKRLRGRNSRPPTAALGNFLFLRNSTLKRRGKVI